MSFIDVIILIAIALLVVLTIFFMMRRRKNSCSNGCSGCPHAGNCANEPAPKEKK